VRGREAEHHRPGHNNRPIRLPLCLLERETDDGGVDNSFAVHTHTDTPPKAFLVAAMVTKPFRCHFCVLKIIYMYTF